MPAPPPAAAAPAAAPAAAAAVGLLNVSTNRTLAVPCTCLKMAACRRFFEAARSLSRIIARGMDTITASPARLNPALALPLPIKWRSMAPILSSSDSSTLTTRTS